LRFCVFAQKEPSNPRLNPALAKTRRFDTVAVMFRLSANKRVTEALAELGGITLLAKEAGSSLLKWRVAWRDLLYQIFSIGVKSQSVVLITGAFTGMVLAAQTYFQFHKVKMDTATLAVVSISMCSELGPVLTALMVAGRVGAAMAAEIGTMRVTEQIDALRALATNPVDYLVVPRLVAAHIALPLLTAESIATGILAGYFVSVNLLGIEPAYLWYNMLKYTHDADLVIGLIKAFIYGGVIALIGCYKGMTCRLGAEGVGQATTEAVVYSSITILIANFFLTLVLGKIASAL
jgi:phospholipid/cholesterol/gamma-HCH transport system permease protein